jgi:hypothetical protein
LEQLISILRVVTTSHLLYFGGINLIENNFRVFLCLY